MTDITSTDWTPQDEGNIAASPNGSQGGFAPNTIPPTIRAIRGAVKRAHNKLNAILVSTGTATALVLTHTVAPTSIVKGERYSFFSSQTNTGAMTLNVNGLGAKSIFQQDGTALKAGQIVSGSAIAVTYDGTAWRLDNYVSNPKFSGTLTADALTVPTINGTTISGTTVSGTLSGNGAGITALNASNIATGTIADARLPATMAGKTFTGDTAVLNTLYVGTGTSGGTLELGKVDGTTGSAVIDFHTSATPVDYNARIIASGNTANGAGILDIISGTLNHNGQEVWDKGMLPTPAVQATQVIAGNGLTGGGTIAANRTITLGAPGTITNSTTNAVTTTSHTHALTLVAADITGALGYTPSKGDGLPIGSMIMLYANDSEAPPGFLLANGAVVTTAYPELRAFGLARGWSVTSGNPRLPDMGGSFPRGWRTGQIVDSGRAFGSVQTDAFQGHKHAQTFSAVANQAWVAFGTKSVPSRTSASFGATNTVTELGLSDGANDSDGINGTPRTAAETRPHNVTVTYWVKAYDVDNTSGSINLSNVTNDLTALQVRTTALETFFQSGNQAYTSGAQSSVNHGLGKKPNWFFADLVCTVANNGWAVGDTLDIASGTQPWPGQGNYGIMLWATSTTVNWQVGQSGIVILTKGSGAGNVAAPFANWALRVRAGF